MIKFDINGAIIEFDEKMDNYNNIRNIFKSNAIEVASFFEEKCLSNIKSIKQLSELALNIGNELLDENFRKAIECIVSYGVISIDFKTFKEAYCKKHLNYERLFNNLNRELLLPNKNKKNHSFNPQQLKATIKKLSSYLYNDCFNIHYGVLDALIDNNVSNITSYINEENIKKSNALFNNYKDGFINKPDECRVVKQIICLNPYRQDIYEFLIKEDGDFNKDIEGLTEYLGYNIKQYKSSLMDIYMKELIEKYCGNIEVAKEKLEKYAKYIGYSNESIYLERLDNIHSFETA